jgi:hypothetical protein
MKKNHKNSLLYSKEIYTHYRQIYTTGELLYYRKCICIHSSTIVILENIQSSSTIVLQESIHNNSLLYYRKIYTNYTKIYTTVVLLDNRKMYNSSIIVLQEDIQNSSASVLQENIQHQYFTTEKYTTVLLMYCSRHSPGKCD